MTFTRRLTLASLLLAGAASAFAQAFAQRPIKFIVPFPAGGGTDNLTRLIATKLTEENKWTFAVENKPGAGGNLALDTTAKAPADGYTWVMAQTDNVVLNPLLYQKLTYDPVKDLQPVALIASGPAVLVVRADSPYKTLADINAAAKAKPDRLTFASPGTGTVAHLISQAWQKSASIKLTHVPFRGAAQALPDLIGGRVDMYMGSIPTLLSHIEGGKVRPIAVTSPQRSSVLPNVPTYTEAGVPGVELASVWGVMVPSGTPANVVNAINTAINKVVQIPEVQEKIRSTGASIVTGTPEKMADLYAADRAKLAPLVRDSGIKLQ